MLVQSTELFPKQILELDLIGVPGVLKDRHKGRIFVIGGRFCKLVEPACERCRCGDAAQRSKTRSEKESEFKAAFAPRQGNSGRVTSARKAASASAANGLSFIAYLRWIRTSGGSWSQQRLPVALYPRGNKLAPSWMKTATSSDKPRRTWRRWTARALLALLALILIFHRPILFRIGRGPMPIATRRRRTSRSIAPSRAAFLPASRSETCMSRRSVPRSWNQSTSITSGRTTASGTGCGAARPNCSRTRRCGRRESFSIRRRLR